MNYRLFDDNRSPDPVDWPLKAHSPAVVDRILPALCERRIDEVWWPSEMLVGKLHLESDLDPWYPTRPGAEGGANELFDLPF
jgi:hypothetical protein